MSRSFSTTAFNQLTNEVNDDPFLLLVRLFGNSGTEYFVNNTVDITSNGQLYTAFPVKVTFAADDGETKPVFKIEFDNVSLQLISELRANTTPISCEIDLVLASNPDVVEMSVKDLLLRNIEYNSQTIKAQLMVDDFLNSRFPTDSYTQINYPGVFA